MEKRSDDTLSDNYTRKAIGYRKKKSGQIKEFLSGRVLSLDAPFTTMSKSDQNRTHCHPYCLVRGRILVHGVRPWLLVNNQNYGLKTRSISSNG